MGEECVEVSGRKPEGKRPLGRPRRRWIYNIMMVDWIGNEPSVSINAGKLPSDCTTFGLLSGTQLHRVS
jgi:hypothetical protein